MINEKLTAINGHTKRTRECSQAQRNKQEKIDELWASVQNMMDEACKKKVRWKYRSYLKKQLE